MNSLTRRYDIDAKGIKLLLGTLIALIVADGVISEFLVGRGLAREGNPFLQIWVTQDAFLSIKLLGSFLAAIILWKMHERGTGLAAAATVFFVVYYTVVVFWSLLVFAIAGKGV